MKNNGTKSNSTFKLKNLNIIFLFIVGIFCLALIISTGHVALKFKNYVTLAQSYATVSTAALDLQSSSDYLTEETRLFTLSYDFKHIENYFNEKNIERHRDNAVAKIKDIANGSPSFYLLQKALEESVALEEMEYMAMKLVCLGKHYDKNPDIKIPEEIMNARLSERDLKLDDLSKISQAWIILFSNEYLSSKLRISNLKSKAIEDILEQTKIAHDESLTELKSVFFRLLLCIFGVFVTNLIFFIGIIRLIISPLYKFIQSIKNHEKLATTKARELNILSSTYNEMFDKNAANEVLLKHKAEHDELTGLFNRSAFNQIKTALENTTEKIALILVDVDYFKHINDTMGHAAGDKVLQKVSQTLSENFRAMDFVTRIGGDEFCVLLTQNLPSDKELHNLIETKLKNIQNQLKNSSDGTPTVTLSCGIAISDNGWEEGFFENADKALYAVKRAGRDNFSFHEKF